MLQCVEVALVPLGTGNDLSRVLGWGGSLSASLNAKEFLRKVEAATPHTLDRWEMQYTPAVGRPNLLTKVMPTREVSSVVKKTFFIFCFFISIKHFFFTKKKRFLSFFFSFFIFLYCFLSIFSILLFKR